MKDDTTLCATDNSDAWRFASKKSRHGVLAGPSAVEETAWSPAAGAAPGVRLRAGHLCCPLPGPAARASAASRLCPRCCCCGSLGSDAFPEPAAGHRGKLPKSVCSTLLCGFGTAAAAWLGAAEPEGTLQEPDACRCRPEAAGGRAGSCGMAEEPALPGLDTTLPAALAGSADAARCPPNALAEAACCRCGGLCCLGRCPGTAEHVQAVMQSLLQQASQVCTSNTVGTW